MSRRRKVVSLCAYRKRQERAARPEPAAPPPAPGPDADDLVNLGVVLFDGGRCQAASYAFRLALSLEPEHALAFFNLGAVLDALEDFTGAIDAYTAALSLDPALADAHYNLARIYQSMQGELWEQTAIRHMHAYRKLTKKK